MSIRLLEPTRSLQSHDEVLAYDHAKLAADRQTRAFAPPFKAMSERLRVVEANQRTRRFAIITEQALASYWGDELDAATKALGVEALLIARNDRESPRFTRYFKNHSPSEVEHLGLESQLEHVKVWPELLRSEPEASLQAFAARFDECAIEGRAALDHLALAEDASSTQRAQEILPLVADINTLRTNTYADLIKIGGKRWARSFFS
jgi:hypothetical protein